MRAAEDHSASVLASQPLTRGLLGDVLEALTSTYAGQERRSWWECPKGKSGLRWTRSRRGRGGEGGDSWIFAEEMARLKSLTLPHGGDWVNALLWGFTCDSRSKGRHQLKKCFLLSIARITWPPPPPSGQLGSLFWTSKTTLSVNFNSRALLQCLIWWWI